MAFSIIRNGEAVLRITPNTSGNRVYAIDGLRALTIGWIIMAHTFAFAAFHSGKSQALEVWSRSRLVSNPYTERNN